MNRFVCAACLFILFLFALCGTALAVSVTLMEKPAAASKAAAASVAAPIVLQFGANNVAIHDRSKSVAGTLLTSGDPPLSNMFLIRDHRGLSQRTEYETIYRHGPFQLAYVPDPALLAGVKRVSMRPVTGSMVVTESAKVTVSPDATVNKILAKLNVTQYGKYLSLLAGDPNLPSRYACSSSEAVAHGIIVKAFQQIGLDQLITDQKYGISSGDCQWGCTENSGHNVIGIKTGTTRPNEYYVVGAHYDSINDTTTPCKTAPGANDNASGVAGVLELARVFKGFTTEASIVFVAFGGEEVDLLGSRRYVQDLITNGKGGDVKAFVVLDMISYYKKAQKIYIEGSNKNETLKAAVDKLVIDTATYTTLQCEHAYDFDAANKGNSDHVPFLEKEIPGGLLIQWESDASDYKYLHSDEDLIKYQKLPFAMEVLKVAAATLAQAGVSTDE